MAAIKCIMSLEYVHDEADPDDIVLRQQIADVVFILLPKIVSTLIQVATGDDTQGHALIAVSTSKWQLIGPQFDPNWTPIRNQLGNGF